MRQRYRRRAWACPSATAVRPPVIGALAVETEDPVIAPQAALMHRSGSRIDAPGCHRLTGAQVRINDSRLCRAGACTGEVRRSQPGEQAQEPAGVQRPQTDSPPNQHRRSPRVSMGKSQPRSPPARGGGGDEAGRSVPEVGLNKAVNIVRRPGSCLPPMLNVVGTGKAGRTLGKGCSAYVFRQRHRGGCNRHGVLVVALSQRTPGRPARGRAPKTSASPRATFRCRSRS